MAEPRCARGAWGLGTSERVLRAKETANTQHASEAHQPSSTRRRSRPAALRAGCLGYVPRNGCCVGKRRRIPSTRLRHASPQHPAAKPPSLRVGESEGRSPSEERIMEAAGVAPASENTSPTASTCVAASDMSHPASSRDEEKPGARSGKISPVPSESAGVGQPAAMTSVPHPQADEDGRSQGFTLRERAAYPQLGLFPSD